MEISIIVAVAKNNVIGKNNDLIWRLPADLKYFKSKTTGHNIIMGRNTFESIGGGRPLPNRITTIITHNKNYQAPEGCLIANSLEEALQNIENETEVFICGGAQIYELAFPIATKLYITNVHHEFEGDTFFPNFDTSKWKLELTEDCKADEKNAYDYTFVTYFKK
jgi:dihydrofolate reductase